MFLTQQGIGRGRPIAQHGVGRYASWPNMGLGAGTTWPNMGLGVGVLSWPNVELDADASLTQHKFGRGPALAQLGVGRGCVTVQPRAGCRHAPTQLRVGRGHVIAQHEIRRQERHNPILGYDFMCWLLNGVGVQKS
jgi:hypothetical protein